MADLIVEDGSGLENADSYASIADADAYAANFGFTEWAAKTDDEKNVALRTGTRYVNDHYAFVGTKKTAEQALQWPRCGATIDGFPVDNSVVPVQVVNATIEAARISLTSDLTPTLARGGQVKREKVDVLETEYFDGAPADTTFNVLDMMLRPLLGVGKSSSVIDLVRA